MARKPSCWSSAEAAAVPLVALTAFACLDRLPPSKQPSGEQPRVVVSGASGGTGMWCVQCKLLTPFLLWEQGFGLAVILLHLLIYNSGKEGL